MSVLEVKNVSIRYMTGDFKDIGLKEYLINDLLVGLVHELPGIAQHSPTEVGVLPDGEVPVESW